SVPAGGQAVQVTSPPPAPQGARRQTRYDPGALGPSADPFSVAVAPPAPPASVGPYTIGARAPGLRLIGWLVTFDGAPDGFSFPLTEGRNSIGRDEDRDLQIDDDKVSANHCCIQ